MPGCWRCASSSASISKRRWTALCEEFFSEHLQRDDARRMLLVREVHDTRAAGADLANDDEVADRRPGRLGRVVVAQHPSQAWRRERSVRKIEHAEQPLDFLSHVVIAGAALVEKVFPFVGRDGRQREEDCGGPIACRAGRSAVRLGGRAHGRSPSGASSPAFSASWSQARANAHSFFTVAGERSIDAAVSSIVSPAK